MDVSPNTRQKKEEMKISPKTVREEGCKERPSSYCCTLMEYAVEESGYIQYEEREKKYIFVDSQGEAVLLISHCPFCGTDITPLGDLLDDKFYEYVGKREALTREDFHKHWFIIREDLPFEETMRLIAEERAKEEDPANEGGLLELWHLQAVHHSPPLHPSSGWGRGPHSPPIASLGGGGNPLSWALVRVRYKRGFKGMWQQRWSQSIGFPLSQSLKNLSRNPSKSE